MKYVAVLTPPLLVCAAFLFGVGAFLRREMRAGRVRSKRVQSEGISDDGPELDTQDEASGRSERVDGT
jgi:hypothetical protein